VACGKFEVLQNGLSLVCGKEPLDVSLKNGLVSRPLRLFTKQSVIPVEHLVVLRERIPGSNFFAPQSAPDARLELRLKLDAVFSCKH
jgi:hypothetical protein